VVDFMGAQQEKASKKMAELEDMKRMIDVQRTPAAKATDGSRFNSAKDDLKAQLSSIKAGLAASSSESKYALDAGDVSAKVRDQLSQLHDAVDQVCLTSLQNGPPLRIRARSGRALQRDAAARQSQIFHHFSNKRTNKYFFQKSRPTSGPTMFTFLRKKSVSVRRKMRRRCPS